METLRAYLTPNAKKQRVQEAESPYDLDTETISDMEEEAEDIEVQPGWARKMQKELLMEMRNMMSPDTMEDLKMNVNNMKLEAGLARAEAEEATMQAGLAHAAAEEATNLCKNLETKVDEVHKSMLKAEDVQKMIEDALGKTNQTGCNGRYAQKPEGVGQDRAIALKIDQFKRTAVVGGFEQDSMRTEVEQAVKDFTKHTSGIEEIYAYRRGSIGFIRFLTADAMWKFLKAFNGKGDAKPLHHGRSLWAAASRSPEDRRKRQTFATYKDLLTNVGLANEEDVDFDARRGILWVGKHRIGE